MRFARAILGRPYIFTIVFLIANFFVFLLMWHSSGMVFRSLGGFPSEVLVAYGAKLNSRINQQHEWWRFITPMFVHVNLLHIVVNMYSLWMVGPYVEKLYGSARFVFFWVVTGIAGVAASYLTVVSPGSRWSGFSFIFKTADGPSAGASGALFGLLGVLFVFGIKFRKELPEGFKRAFGTGLLPVIMINLVLGYVLRQYIDNAAHLGGLISGAVLALAVSYRKPGERSGMALAWQVLQVAALALVAVSFVKIAQHFPASLAAAKEIHQSEPPDARNASLLFAKAMSDGQEALQSALKGDITGVDAAVAAIEGSTAPDFKGDQLKRKLQSLLREAKPLPLVATPPPGARQKSEQDQRTRLQADYKSWKAEYDQWVKGGSLLGSSSE